MPLSWMSALLGGFLIGFAALLMLSLNGRVMGISGILRGLLNSRSGDSLWRGLFGAGMMIGGGMIRWYNPEALENTLSTPVFILIIAGLLVGFGTSLGNGCTSGHGICGLSRWSLRSLVATLTFMSAGVMTVALIRWGGWL